MKTETQYLEEIGIAKNEISNAESLLRDAKLKLDRLLIDRYIMRFGLNIGDDVQWKEWCKENGVKDSHTKTGKITGFVVKFEKAAPVVTYYKKDKTLGVLKRDYWNGVTQPTKI